MDKNWAAVRLQSDTVGSGFAQGWESLIQLGYIVHQ